MKSKKAPLKPFVIYRPLWYRGKRAGSLLHRSDGKECCLGQLGRACGIPVKALDGESLPADLSEDCDSKWPRKLRPSRRGEYGELIDRIVVVNDKINLKAAEREAQLTKLFAEAGVAVTFTDTEIPDYLKDEQP